MYSAYHYHDQITIFLSVFLFYHQNGIALFILSDVESK